ncbi:hypothetical protein [Halorubrum lipolyticum]|uniref:Uncharacterized protein n=1 Tax=Halorubrum lipolyticum DSM 21995 TaxID=1227482 RepID=M0NGP7_9EURY|nr:hypothetical protein [Halorubrum lipolyticum]EMA57152.1 hypothetical protein C469_15508 [Halorubrum lipolyticum DSM 21995]
MTEIVELGTRDDANAVRDDYADHLTGRFDRRFAKVELADDIPDDVEAEIRGVAADGRADREGGAGHAELTDGEKRRVGPFTGSNNYRKATAVKAAFLDAGIDDWEAYYDPELTADENTGRIEEVRQQQTGADVSDGPIEGEALQKEAAAAARVEGEECDHARNMCQHGNADACEHLTKDCGADETEVSSLLDFAEAVPYDHLDGETKGALSRSWSGYKVSVKRLASLLDEVQREFRNAERAAAAIDAIEEGISDANTERFKALEGHHRALLNLYGSHDDRLHGQPGRGRDPTDADLADRAPVRPAVPERPAALGSSSSESNTTEQLLRDDRHVDDPDPDGGLGRFGVEADEGRDAPSEEHRRAQNRGYVRSGSRGFADDASAREGLGQFAATGGEETLDNFEETDA